MRFWNLLAGIFLGMFLHVSKLWILFCIDQLDRQHLNLGFPVFRSIFPFFRGASTPRPSPYCHWKFD